MTAVSIYSTVILLKVEDVLELLKEIMLSEVLGIGS